MTFARKGGLNRHNLTVHSDFVYNCPYEGCTHAGYKCSKVCTIFSHHFCIEIQCFNNIVTEGYAQFSEEKTQRNMVVVIAVL